MKLTSYLQFNVTHLVLFSRSSRYTLFRLTRHFFFNFKDISFDRCLSQSGILYRSSKTRSNFARKVSQILQYIDLYIYILLQQAYSTYNISCDRHDNIITIIYKKRRRKSVRLFIVGDSWYLELHPKRCLQKGVWNITTVLTCPQLKPTCSLKLNLSPVYDLRVHLFFYIH
jgi:hypothetical protein